MKLTLIALATLGGFAVPAQTVNIVTATAPVAGSSIQMCDTFLIAWNKAASSPVDTISSILLEKGPPIAIQPILQIASNVSISDDQFVWTFPGNLTPASDYVITFGSSPDISFTGFFTLTKGPCSSGFTPSTGGSTSDSTGSSTGSSSSGSAPGTNSSVKPNAATKAAPAALGILAAAAIAAVL